MVEGEEEEEEGEEEEGEEEEGLEGKYNMCMHMQP